jgi:YD repeat-containing protein
MGSASLARAIVLTALMALFALPGVSWAALDIHNESTAVSEFGGGDGIISPGDSLDVTETVRSSEPGDDLTGITGLVTTSTPNVTVPQGTSAFPTLGFGLTSANTTPYRVQVGGSLDCGQSVNLSLGLTADQGTAAVPFAISTGVASAPVDRTSVDVPHAIPDAATLTSTLPVAPVGRVKDIAVHIGKITHDYVGDLRIVLIAPDGTRVVLVDQRGGLASNFVDTTITADQGSPIAGASAPFTGTFKADGDLSAMVGRQQQGVWKLEVSDLSAGDLGTLDSWGISIADATCAAQPIASFVATPNPALPGDTVQFDASGTHDPVGTVDHYEWDFDDDGTFETDTGSSPLASHAFATRGAYPVSLRVTDDGLLQNVYTRTVNVTHPPTAVLTHTPLTPLTKQTVSLDASGSSDSDGPIADYSWDLDGDGIFETDSGTLDTNTTKFDTPGVHTVRVRVTDGDGATDTAALAITAANRPPTATIAAPGLGVVGRAMTFDGSPSSDPDGTVDKWEWDLDGDGSYETDAGSFATIQHTFDSAGPATVRLRVTDSDGDTATSSVTFPVTNAPVVVFSATPNPARPNQLVALSAAGSSDPDGSALTYKWDLDSNGTFETDTAAVATTSRSWATTGSRTLKVQVTDADGASTVATKIVDVNNDLPVPSVAVSGGTATAGTPVTFDASASNDPDGTIARYEWDLDGNGSYETDTAASAAAVRTYPNAGTVPVRLRVTDNEGGVATTTFSLLVDPAAAAGGTGGTGGTGGSGGTGGTGGTGGSGGSGGATPLGEFSAGLGGAPIQALKLARRTGLTMSCTSDRAMHCALTAMIDGRTAKKLHLARRPKAAKVGSVVLDVVAGGDGRFVLKLTKKARKALKRVKRLRRVRLIVKGTAVDGEGHTVSLTRVVLLR